MFSEGRGVTHEGTSLSEQYTGDARPSRLHPVQLACRRHPFRPCSRPRLGVAAETQMRIAPSRRAVAWHRHPSSGAIHERIRSSSARTRRRRLAEATASRLVWDCQSCRSPSSRIIASASDCARFVANSSSTDHPFFSSEYVTSHQSLLIVVSFKIRSHPTLGPVSRVRAAGFCLTNQQRRGLETIHWPRRSAQ